MWNFLHSPLIFIALFFSVITSPFCHQQKCVKALGVVKHHSRCTLKYVETTIIFSSYSSRYSRTYWLEIFQFICKTKTNDSKTLLVHIHNDVHWTLFNMCQKDKTKRVRSLTTHVANSRYPLNPTIPTYKRKHFKRQTNWRGLSSHNILIYSTNVLFWFSLWIAMWVPKFYARSGCLFWPISIFRVIYLRWALCLFRGSN